MPTRDTAWPDGTPCWIDYAAPDVPGAQRFYTSVLGWTYEGGQPEYGGYFTAMKDGRAAAGLGPQMSPDQPAQWATYFAASDAAAAAEKVVAAGGTVVVPVAQVGPMGTMAIAQDPQGSPFGLWQAGDASGVQIFNEPGSLVWNEAAVENPEAARAFYASVFGFEFDEIPGADGYATFRTDDRPLGGLGGLAPGSPSGWTCCFAVESTDQAVERVEQAGGKVTTAATDTEYGRFAVLEDPWGAAFSVMEVAAA